ncbi:hypothetical protein GF386_02025 [Candidatus Pacearchaeota archaeon]|nr:hypothetical protein [Candidatus Pacearchaeota archaeon]MBD3282951.1 hypothetical protein [Candidatus Pacearchaeota archaeon]
METVKKGDFIEIEFKGKYDDKIFDTTDPKEAKEIGIENQDVKPVVVSAGNKMLLKGFDKSLEGKEIGKSYNIHLTPDKAFGSRNPDLIKTLSIRIFKEKNMNPVAGMTVELDNNLAKILSVSGGRVIVDFNNPLAGKEIDYEFKVKRKITDDNEKINSLQDFFFRQRFEFSIKNKKVMFKDKKLKPVIGMFKEKFQEILGFEIDFAEESKEDKKAENKN